MQSENSPRKKHVSEFYPGAIQPLVDCRDTLMLEMESKYPFCTQNDE